MNLFQHASHSNEMMAEDLLSGIEELEDALIAYRIVDVGTVFACYHNIPVPQDGQLLRSVCWFHIKALADLIDSQFTIPQRIENRYSQWVGQGFEEFGFEVAELLPHPASLDLHACKIAHLQTFAYILEVVLTGCQPTKQCELGVELGFFSRAIAKAAGASSPSSQP